MEHQQGEIQTLLDAVVRPLTRMKLAAAGLPGEFDGGVYAADGSISTNGLQLKHCYRNVPLPFDPGDVVESVEGEHLFCGMLQTGHFGHFMVESLGRLWALRHHPRVGSLVFYARSPGAPCPRYAHEAIRLLGYDGPVRLVRQATRFERLYVPSQLARPESGIIWGYPGNLELARRLRQIAPAPFRDVYVSRSRLRTSDGGFVLECQIEQNLQAQGYEIIHPQEMTLEQQFAVYNGARRLIFADGSALHVYALVARREQSAFAIWRRKPGGVFGAQIQSFGGPPLLGQATVKELWVPDTGFGAMARTRAVLDFSGLRDQLVQAGFIQPAPWDIPSKQAVEGELHRIHKDAGITFHLLTGAVI